jgi:release factor glutamine methyltransferase
VFASDLTAETVSVARHNAQRLALPVTIGQGDMFAGIADYTLSGTVDLVVCNPPYISTSKLDGDSAHLLENEPREAFDAGPYGIAFHQRLIAEAAPLLKQGGWLAFEFGAGQDRQVKALLARARIYGPARFASDAAGTPRVAIVQLL